MDSVFCTNCGKYSTAGSKFCVTCGVPLVGTGPQAAPTRKKSRLVLLIALVVVIVIAVWAFWPSRDVAFRRPEENTETAFPQTIAASGCKKSDIAVDKLRGAIIEGGFVRVTGRVVNNCASAVGVELKLTFYGKDGAILKVNDGFWPASVHNIPAGHGYTFEDLEDQTDGFSKFDVEVVGVNVW